MFFLPAHYASHLRDAADHLALVVDRPHSLRSPALTNARLLKDSTGSVKNSVGPKKGEESLCLHSDAVTSAVPRDAMPLQVYYLGPPGTYTHSIALHFIQDGDSARSSSTIRQSLEDAASAWCEDEYRHQRSVVPLALMPYENSTYGLVLDTQSTLIGPRHGGANVSLGSNGQLASPSELSPVVVAEATRAVRHALLGSRRARDRLRRKDGLQALHDLEELDLSRVTKCLSRPFALTALYFVECFVTANAFQGFSVASTALGARLAASTTSSQNTWSTSACRPSSSIPLSAQHAAGNGEDTRRRSGHANVGAASDLQNGGHATRPIESDKDEVVVAIGTEQAAEELDLVVLQRNIQDRDDNETRFLLVAPNEQVARAYRSAHPQPLEGSRAMLLLRTDSHSTNLTSLLGALCATANSRPDQAPVRIRKVDRKAFPLGDETRALRGSTEEERDDASSCETAQAKQGSAWPSVYFVEVESAVSSARLDDDLQRRLKASHDLQGVRVLGVWQVS
ncbi:PREPHENATE DEHYDRATASE-RELATED [Ceraceosorus bombacis]|uniref:PREPHENATE DEHYDRATASE-RELATED n=1 Tax=Ceraceosorus bombacis TaxID=401625 RepID=A0A0N7L984_9BASI|nr:PREPHENATE DEHYDRATASE-RELATED [Ceraceosorus bombacis]